MQVAREKIIKDYIDKKGIVPIGELMALTNRSLSTVRRDLLALEEKGLILRKRGGAVGQKRELINCFSEQVILNADEKRRIAQKALSLIKSGESLFIGSGTTCDILCEELQGIPNLNIVTTSVYGAMLLSQSKASTTVLLGGKVYHRDNFYETVGDYKDLNGIIDKYNFNRCFISLDGVDAARGFFLQKEEQIGLYRSLMKNSDDFYIMLSSEKFGKKAFVKLCPLQDVKSLILPDKIPKKYREVFEKEQINIY